MSGPRFDKAYDAWVDDYDGDDRPLCVSHGCRRPTWHTFDGRPLCALHEPKRISHVNKTIPTPPSPHRYYAVITAAVLGVILGVICAVMAISAALLQSERLANVAGVSGFGALIVGALGWLATTVNTTDKESRRKVISHPWPEPPLPRRERRALAAKRQRLYAAHISDALEEESMEREEVIMRARARHTTALDAALAESRRSLGKPGGTI